jgi:hypothetical protein
MRFIKRRFWGEEIASKCISDSSWVERERSLIKSAGRREIDLRLPKNEKIALNMSPVVALDLNSHKLYIWPAQSTECSLEFSFTTPVQQLLLDHAVRWGRVLVHKVRSS